MVSSIPGQKRQAGESAMLHFASAVLVCLQSSSLHSRKLVVALSRALYRAVVIVLRAACMCLSCAWRDRNGVCWRQW
eukprot:1644416-Rhodomonas_salina.1